MSSASSQLPTASRDHKAAAIRYGFRIFVGALFIPFVVVGTIRFVFAGTVVNPNASLFAGVGITALVLAAGYAGGLSLRAARSGDDQRYERWSWWAAFLGFASTFSVIAQWRTLDLPAANHFAQAYELVTGTWAVYAFVGALLHWAMRLRHRRIPFTPEDHWGIEAVVNYGVLPLVAWVGIFIILYVV